MNPELQKIEKYIKSLGFQQKTFTDLSKSKKGEKLVTDNNTAFNFDDISDYFHKIQLSSADALLLRENLYLIEFKHIEKLINSMPEFMACSIICPSANLSESVVSLQKELLKLQRKLLRLNLSQKMAESFHTLRECIFVNSQTDQGKFEKHFILVTENALKSIRAGYMRKAGAIIDDISDESFKKYQQEYKNTPESNQIRVYYDSIDIWAVDQFPKRVANLK